MKLYEIVESLKELETLLEDANELSDEEQLKLIDSIISKEKDLKVKVDNTIAVIKTLEGEEKIYTKEIERLKRLRASNKNYRENLRSYLLHYLQALQIDKMRTKRFSFSIYESQPKMTIEDMDLLPEDCLRADIVPNDSLIKEKLLQGEEVSGAYLEKKTTIRIS
jgi:vacuolar-type H+-ATPase subunit I/STV1